MNRNLKHVFCMACFIFFLLSTCGCSSNTSSSSEPKTASEVTLLVNGQAAGSNMPAVIINGSTMVPIAFAAEYLGANVNYESSTRTVIMRQGDTQVKFMIDGKTYKNGKPVTVDTPAVIKDGLILAPLSLTCQAFAASLSWDGPSKTAAITKTFEANERQLPENGTIAKYYSATANSPLRITTSSGPAHYYVKLARWGSKEPVLTVFIKSGQTVDLQVPSGTYEIKYAAGEKWYGERDLFGPETAFTKAEKEFAFSSGRGHRIELIYQPGGNLSTSQIQRTDF